MARLPLSNPGPPRSPADLLALARRRGTQLRRHRRRLLYGGPVAAAVIAAIAVPLAVTAGASRTSVQVISPPPSIATTLSPSVTATATTTPPTTITTPATTVTPECSRRSGPYGTLTVCPGSALVGATVTITASGCKNLSALAFLGPLAYIGSSGGGAQVPGQISASGDFTIRYRIPASYGSGGNVQQQIPVGPGSDYQISSYPAGECSAPIAVTGPPGTEQIAYTPYSVSGQLDPTLHVTGIASGTCATYMGAAGDQLYARCFSTAGPIFDPCFVDPAKGDVPSAPLACPSDPRTGDVTTFTAASFNSEGLHLQVIEPWAFDLANGQVCRFVSAAWGSSGPYDCRGSGSTTSSISAVADCRVPQPAAPWWTTSCQPQLSDSSPFSPAIVTKVWF